MPFLLTSLPLLGFAARKSCILTINPRKLIYIFVKKDSASSVMEIGN